MERTDTNPFYLSGDDMIPINYELQDIDEEHWDEGATLYGLHSPSSHRHGKSDYSSSEEEEDAGATLGGLSRSQVTMYEHEEDEAQLGEFHPSSPYWRGTTDEERAKFNESMWASKRKNPTKYGLKDTKHKSSRSPDRSPKTRRELRAYKLGMPSQKDIHRKLLTPILGKYGSYLGNNKKKRRKRFARKKNKDIGLPFERVYVKGFKLSKTQHVLLSARVNYLEKGRETGLTFCSFNIHRLVTAVRFFSWETIVAILYVCGRESFAFRCQQSLRRGAKANQYEAKVRNLAVSAFLVTCLLIDANEGQIRIHPDLEEAVEECLLNVRLLRKGLADGNRDKGGVERGEKDWYKVNSRIELREKNSRLQRNKVMANIFSTKRSKQKRRKRKKKFKLGSDAVGAKNAGQHERPKEDQQKEHPPATAYQPFVLEDEFLVEQDDLLSSFPQPPTLESSRNHSGGHAANHGNNPERPEAIMVSIDSKSDRSIGICLGNALDTTTNSLVIVVTSVDSSRQNLRDLKLGDRLTHVNRGSIASMPFEQVVSYIKSVKKRPFFTMQYIRQEGGEDL